MAALRSILFTVMMSLPAFAAPLVVWKLDDMNVANGKVPERWQRLTNYVEERRMKTSIGIIGNSLEGDHPEYVSELKRLNATGLVEFWHHGYDHKRSDEDGKTLCEFSGTDRDHQGRHFRLTQNLTKQKLGITLRTFGAPFNATDAATIDVLAASPEIRVWLQGDPRQAAGKIVVRMANEVNIENPVHKPNFDAFAKGYEARNGNHPSVYILQGHPNSWDETAFAEFARIVGFLDAQGCRYVFPAELPELLK
jgi:hypothetical protein